MCKGYIDAYLSLEKRKYLKKGLKNAQFIIENNGKKMERYGIHLKAIALLLMDIWMIMRLQ